VNRNRQAWITFGCLVAGTVLLVVTVVRDPWQVPIFAVIVIAVIALNWRDLRAHRRPSGQQQLGRFAVGLLAALVVGLLVDSART
jgi:membrane protein implicated in regulation of membrane protease activity